MENKTEIKHTSTPWEWGTNFAAEEYSPNGVVIRPKNEFPHGRWVADLGRSYDEEAKANAAFIVRACNSFEALLEFSKKHHEVCEECEGTGKIYNNADPTSGQWVECPYAKAIDQAEGK